MSEAAAVAEQVGSTEKAVVRASQVTAQVGWEGSCYRAGQRTAEASLSVISLVALAHPISRCACMAGCLSLMRV